MLQVVVPYTSSLSENSPTLLIWSTLYLCAVSDVSAKCSTVTSLLTEKNLSLLKPVHAKARASA
jgi:hypothetical protein